MTVIPHIVTSFFKISHQCTLYFVFSPAAGQPICTYTVTLFENYIPPVPYIFVACGGPTLMYLYRHA